MSDTQDWAGGLKLVRRAVTEMTATVKLMKDLGDTSKAKPGEVDAKVAKSAQDRFTADYAKAKARLDALKAPTAEPPAADIQTKIAPFEAALAKADTADQAHDLVEANEALFTATAAADEAERVAALRKKFNATKKGLSDQAATKPTALKDEVTAVLAAATADADKFDFGAATKTLDNADALLEGEKVKALAATPDAAALGPALEKMMKANGGAAGTKNGPKQLDDIVDKLPAGTDPKVIAKVAKARFGIDLSVSTDDTPEKNLAAIRNLYKTLAMTPDEVMNSPSLKKVTRTNTFKTGGGGALDSGGAYDTSTNETTMQGRPDSPSKQKFGAATGQLPAVEGPDYAPADATEVDYFEFANVHETGHSVDDRLKFMDSRLGDSKFGGWQVHAGNIGPIAKLAAEKWGGKFADKLEKHVLETMTGNKPGDKPTVDPGDQAELDNSISNIDWWVKATNSDAGPWWNQTMCGHLTMSDGRVYYQASAGRWVSYPAAERKKGITGYQFRAPPEWFAELFAAYKFGKLKGSHPAASWLKDVAGKPGTP